MLEIGSYNRMVIPNTPGNICNDPVKVQTPAWLFFCTVDSTQHHNVWKHEILMAEIMSAGRLKRIFKYFCCWLLVGLCEHVEMSVRHNAHRDNHVWVEAAVWMLAFISSFCILIKRDRCIAFSYPQSAQPSFPSSVVWKQRAVCRRICFNKWSCWQIGIFFRYWWPRKITNKSVTVNIYLLSLVIYLSERINIRK